MDDGLIWVDFAVMLVVCVCVCFFIFFLFLFLRSGLIWIMEDKGMELCGRR